MTPIKDVMTLSADVLLDHAKIDEIMSVFVFRSSFLARSLIRFNVWCWNGTKIEWVLEDPDTRAWETTLLHRHASRQESMSLSFLWTYSFSLTYPLKNERIKLLHYNPEEPQKVSSLPLSTLPEAKPTINCFQALNYFQTGRAHLLLITSKPGKEGGALGLISFVPFFLFLFFFEGEGRESLSGLLIIEGVFLFCFGRLEE